GPPAEPGDPLRHPVQNGAGRPHPLCPGGGDAEALRHHRPGAGGPPAGDGPHPPPVSHRTGGLIMGTRRCRVALFTVAQWEEEAAWLRRQHQKGWRCTHLTAGIFYHFEACPPEDVVY